MADALADSPDFRKFVTGSESDASEETNRKADETTAVASSKTDESPPVEPRKKTPVAAGARSTRSVSKRRENDRAYEMTLSRATIQKTVRFQPELVAELESLNHHKSQQGERPLSFQEVQNEALRMWLRRARSM
jgi:hypothetical protein